MVKLRNGKDTEIMNKYFNRSPEEYTKEFVIGSYRELFEQFNNVRDTVKINEQVKWVNYILKFTESLPKKYFRLYPGLVNASIAACNRNITSIQEIIDDPELQKYIDLPLFTSTIADLQYARVNIQRHLPCPL